jgi:hypothetical protein
MVFFARTAQGLAEALRRAVGREPVWCIASAIPEAEYARLGASNLTRFAESASTQPLAQVLDTINQHHPGESIWVEHRAEL